MAAPYIWWQNRAPKYDPADMMQEQLGYLLDHRRRCGNGVCNDCLRLKQVEMALLEPFRSRYHYVRPLDISVRDWKNRQNEQVSE